MIGISPSLLIISFPALPFPLPVLVQLAGVANVLDRLLSIEVTPLLRVPSSKTLLVDLHFLVLMQDQGLHHPLE